MTQPPTSTPIHARGEDRLTALDIARSLAALAVVLWHWQHFQFSGYALRDGFERAAQPLYFLLFPFYEGGWFAVDFFFMLSGYIFFWKYRAGISGGAFGAGKFFMLRFSRLYPLHLLTLVIVAALQAVYFRIHGHFFVFPFNDLYHFGLQLFLASQWGLQRGASFNDPVWSLSVEVLLYAMFFCIAKHTSSRWPLLLILSALGFALYAANISNAIGRGVFCFFLGGALSYLLQAVASHRARPAIETAIYLAVPLLVVFDLILWRHGLVGHLSETLGSFVIALNPGLSQLQAAVSDRLSRIMTYALATTLLFPFLIAGLVLLERRFHAQIHNFSFIGNISYSSYLLHIPLQLACVLLLPAFFSDPASAENGAAMLAFIVVLIGISFLSFYFFESPAQKFVRRRVIGHKWALRTGNVFAWFAGARSIKAPNGTTTFKN